MLFRKNIHFSHPSVASLAWAIGSPPLLADGRAFFLDETWYDRQFELHRSWLLELDSDPTDLEHWLEKDHQKLLGKRFESLLGYWFNRSPHFTLLHHNVQLKEGQNTPGEIDFIVKENETGKLIHIESACKYYLGAGRSASWNKWIGPNGHDTLELKMKKLEAQRSIFNTSAGKLFLSENDLPRPVSFAFLKGYFFHHYSTIAGAIAPRDAHRHYSSGWYVMEKELEEFAQSPAQWLMPPKSMWMAPYDFELAELQLMDGWQMIENSRAHLARTRKAPMIIQVTMHDGVAEEVSRGFVVRDGWPE